MEYLPALLCFLLKTGVTLVQLGLKCQGPQAMEQTCCRDLLNAWQNKPLPATFAFPLHWRGCQWDDTRRGSGPRSCWAPAVGPDDISGPIFVVLRFFYVTGLLLFVCSVCLCLCLCWRCSACRSSERQQKDNHKIIYFLFYSSDFPAWLSAAVLTERDVWQRHEV